MPAGPHWRERGRRCRSDFQEQAVGLEEASECRLEVPNLVGDFSGMGIASIHGRPDAEASAAIMARTRPLGAFLRLLGLHELLVETGQRRHLAIHRGHAK